MPLRDLGLKLHKFYNLISIRTETVAFEKLVGQLIAPSADAAWQYNVEI